MIVSTPLPNNFTTDVTIRAGIYDNAKTYLVANPGVVFLVYGPTNGGAHTDDDRIWDSRVNSI